MRQSGGLTMNRQRKAQFTRRITIKSAAQGRDQSAPAVTAGIPIEGLAFDYGNPVSVADGGGHDAVAEVAPLRTHTTGHEGGAGGGILVTRQVSAGHPPDIAERFGQRQVDLFEG